jgi:hypothetical protein
MCGSERANNWMSLVILQHLSQAPKQSEFLLVVFQFGATTLPRESVTPRYLFDEIVTICNTESGCR